MGFFANVLTRPRPAVVPRDVQLCGLDNAWLSPRGEVHPVQEYGHCNYANRTLHIADYTLEDHRWIKLSHRGWIVPRPGSVTQPQLDVISDWHVANAREFDATRYPVD